MEHSQVIRKVSNVALKGAERSAVKTAGIFCRAWLHEVPVPKVLLNPEVR